MTIPDRRSRHQADAASCSGPPRWHWRRLPGGGRAAAQGADKPFRIDVHHHLSPPTYVTASNESGFGDPLMKNWTIEKSLADMDKAGVATAMLSVTTPGINSSKREIEYAFDTLKADGIALMTSYGDKWLGDPLFLPIMEELNRRKALVYTHPTAANCCVNLVPTQQPVMIEFGTDTTRTIADIVFSGNARRFSDIRWIFSHAGGTMPCPTVLWRSSSGSITTPRKPRTRARCRRWQPSFHRHRSCLAPTSHTARVSTT